MGEDRVTGEVLARCVPSCVLPAEGIRPLCHVEGVVMIGGDTGRIK